MYITKLLILVLLPLWSHLVAAQAPLDCSPQGVGVGGYDLVSYHSEEGPVLGRSDLQVVYEGTHYRFSSAANQATFEQSPERYMPVYRGYCAATLSMGRLACPDYTNFKLEEGRLLLFELAGFTNGRTLWNSDPLGFRQRADSNFKKLLN